MGIVSISKRARYGDRLLQLKSEGDRGIQMLQGLTQTLPQLHDDINADTGLSQQERDDAVAEVNAVIVDLVAQVKAFADSL